MYIGRVLKDKRGDTRAQQDLTYNMENLCAICLCTLELNLTCLANVKQVIQMINVSPEILLGEVNVVQL